MSDDDDLELHNTLSIHIDIDEEASADEAEAFFNDLGEWVGEWMETHKARGQWDPFLYAHKQSCDESDHCHGPGSWVESQIAARVLRTFADHHVRAQTAGRIEEDLRARADEYERWPK